MKSVVGPDITKIDTWSCEKQQHRNSVSYSPAIPLGVQRLAVCAETLDQFEFQQPESLKALQQEDTVFFPICLLTQDLKVYTFLANLVRM